MNINNKKIIFFDIDGTLAKSKSSITEDMALCLKSLLLVKKVAIISGGNFAQFDKQIISKLPIDSNLSNLYVMPTSGAELLTYEGGTWQKKYSYSLTDDEVNHITSTLEKAINRFPEYFVGHSYGDIIENRVSQVTFSALGQLAPLSLKSTWDPDSAKRLALVRSIKDDLAEFSVRIGGTTSIDISKKGIDKKFGITELLDYLNLETTDALFIGDKILPGGNDYPAFEMGLDCLAVQDETATLAHIQSWLT